MSSHSRFYFAFVMTVLLGACGDREPLTVQKDRPTGSRAIVSERTSPGTPTHAQLVTLLAPTDMSTGYRGEISWTVIGEGTSIADDTSFELIEWPSLRPVPAQVGARQIRYTNRPARRYVLTPSTPLAGGWYALRMTNSAGLPAQGARSVEGSIVSRFCPESQPLVRDVRVSADRDTTLVELRLSELVRDERQTREIVRVAGSGRFLECSGTTDDSLQRLGTTVLSLRCQGRHEAGHLRVELDPQILGGDGTPLRFAFGTAGTSLLLSEFSGRSELRVDSSVFES